MIYHWIIAVLGIGLLLYGWLWIQRRLARQRCGGLADEAACVIGPGCHGCGHAALAGLCVTRKNSG